MNRRHFNTSKAKANKITHYIMRNDGGAVFVKEAEFFVCQGGLTQKWGKAWRGINATSIEHARIIGQEILP